jgi:hypothetical protein
VGAPTSSKKLGAEIPISDKTIEKRNTVCGRSRAGSADVQEGVSALNFLLATPRAAPPDHVSCHFYYYVAPWS